MDTRLEITAIDIRKFKRLDEVALDTGADKYILLLAGEETNGKTSVLDAVRCALGGGDETPADPVKHGADVAKIKVTLNDGLYVVDLTVGTDRKRKLTITGPDGTIGAPQTWLDRLFEGKFIDPGKFLRETDAEQVKTLLRVIGVDVQELDAVAKRAYDARTEAGRRLKDAKGALTSVPSPSEEPAPARPISEVNAELDALDTKGNLLVRAQQHHDGLVTTVSDAVAHIENLESQLKVAREGLLRNIEWRDEAAQACPAPGVIDGLRARRTELREEASRSESRARWEATCGALSMQHTRASDLVKKLENEINDHDETIESTKDKKVKLLASATMPVPGLTLGDAGLLLDGVPFSQASYAQRLRTSLVISMRQSPKFRDVLMRVGGNDFSEKGLAAVRELAKEMDCRIWIEQVGEDRGPSAIVIRDGNVLKRPTVKK